MPNSENEEMKERIASARERIHLIPSEKTVPGAYRDFFIRTAKFLLSVTKKVDNYVLYEDILPENYARSYANPDFAVEKLGNDLGPVLSSVYAELRSLIPAVFEDRLEDQAALYELFLMLYFEFERDPDDLPERSTVVSIYSSYLRDYLSLYVSDRIRTQVDASDDFAASIIRHADFSDVTYLYRYGEYISKETVRCARFINSLPEQTIQKMAHTFTEGFRLGFVHAHKDLAKKKTVQIVYELGFERMIRAAFDDFEKMGLQPTLVRAPSHLATWTANRHNGYTGAIPNPQFDDDHKDDLSLVMDDDFVSERNRCTQEAYEAVKEKAAEHAGPAVLETFGETPFEPKTSKYALTYSRSELQKYLSMKNSLLSITKRYIPEKERSFTIIDFPVPAIGKNFESIFKETIEINTLSNEKYTRIQQHLIDALDLGTSVHVQGRGGNETDLTVALHPIDDPAKQTKFENCVADVNIPVGEVFTSPQLQGTNGLLHVGHVFLEGFEFRNLKIRLKDGMIADYSCDNFPEKDRNRKYIEDHILYHHPTLTIGEFAIGTNTLAYVMGRKYGIEKLMPILIAEKTGPHFAMGDTCYSWEEDNPVFNPDGKEIIARDNEHTLIRRTDPSKAYYGCHTDITIPYDELGSIRVIKEDGSETVLIENGRFVLPGTQELNQPLDLLENVH